MNTKFTPVRCREDTMPSKLTNGYIYFAIDTGKIYIDTETERLNVGGSGIAILYANFPGDVQPDEEGYYTFELSDLAEGSIKPHEQDLILNSDGTFYKVMEVQDEYLICRVVSVSGSGGGGTGPSTGSRTALKILDVENTSLINGQPVSIQFIAASEKDPDGNFIDSTVEVEWILEEHVGGEYYQQYANGKVSAGNNETMTLNITKYIRPSATSRLKLKAHTLNGDINNGYSFERNVVFITSELTLTMATDFSNIKLFETNNAPITYNISGNMNKIVDIYLGKGDASSKIIKTYELGPGTALNEICRLDREAGEPLEHGYYKVMIKVSQNINGKRGLSIDPIKFEIAVKDNSSNLPIIWLGSYSDKYYNYDDIKIPFLVYDPDNLDTTVVHLYRNGIEMAGSPRNEKGSGQSKFSTFEIVDAEVKVRNYYSISCGEDKRRVERKIEFLVEEDPNRKMELVDPDSLKLLFDAKGRTNSESSTNRTNWSYNGIQATFENFNWYNNGWMQDAIGNTCLRISNGAKFKIPVGKLTLAGSSTTTTSAAIEMQFKVRNIQDYTPLIHNVTRYKSDDTYYAAFKAQNEYTNYDSFLAYWLPLQIGENGKPIMEYDKLEFDRVQKDINISKAIVNYVPDDGSTFGLCVGPQDAFFSNGTNTVNVSFVEDEMIYLTAVYTNASKLLSIYINGVLTGVIESTLTSEFEIGNDNIVFNSEFCDIDLYKLRIYDKNLTMNNVITNYAVDKKDVVIFDQNNVDSGFVIDNGDIGELQLQLDGVQNYNINNPDKYTMPYIIFDTTATDEPKKLPWSKKTKIDATVTFVNPALDRAYDTGELEELAIEDGLCKATDSAEDKAAAVEYYYVHHCPSWTGDNVEMAVQGTSSEFYPRRNYKLKTKPDDDVNIFLNQGPFMQRYLEHGKNFKDNPCHQKFFYMNNYEVGTTKFTMKIDYMESSGSYNTGFANLVANAYSKHPMQDYVNKHRFVDSDGNEKELSQKYLDSVRTSVQGFPVMAFHKRNTTGNPREDYVYIGRYNMNLDKGSDECFGFKPIDKNLYILDTNGNPVEVKKTAECWEMQNNSRGYCSFRDPWNRKELSFDGTGLDNCYTSYGSPIVADNIEYRYSAYDDALDGLWELSENTSTDSKITIFTNLGWLKEVDAIEDGWVEGDDYIIFDSIIYKRKEKELLDKYYNFYGEMIDDGNGNKKVDPADPHLEPGRKLFLRLLQNWERATKWVWSTNTDNVISGGEYTPAEVGKVLYEPGTYYILTENEQQEEVYIEDPGTTYDENIIYYKKTSYVVDGEEIIAYINAYAVGDENLVYAKNKFYAKADDGKTYVLQTDEEFNETIDYYAFKELTDVEMDAKIANPNEETLHTEKLTQEVKIDGINYRYDTKEYRLAKFRDELPKHFNVEYLATYFVMTEVFECYDSRGKNAMWASWGPQIDGGDYIWYPIFYDIDTQLGINNTGIPSFEYNVDATDDGNYSTSDSLLWNNFYKTFKTSYILQKYKQLRGETVSIFDKIKNPILKSVDKIEKWYKCDPDECNSLAMRGIRPLIAINLDEYYKYLTIYNPKGTNPDSPLYGLTGRIDDEGNYVVESTSYHYALQGDRSLSRRQFLANRIEYMDSWLNVGNYSRGGTNRLWGRISARRFTQGQFLNSDQWYEIPSNPDTSYYLDKNETVKRHDFDAEYWATLTPIRDSYVTVQDDSAVYPSKKFSGTPLKVKFDALENGIRTANDYNEQLCYIYGINQMKDLGDLYRMYWQEFKIEGKAGKLTKLLLGCDGLMTKKNEDGTYSVVLDENGDTQYQDDKLNPDGSLKAYRWFNNKMNLPSMPAGEGKSGMPLLKEANFSNITISTENPVLDLTTCEKLEDFRATGSNFAQVKFAPGVALNTLYLPNTITTLELREAKLLKNIVETYNYPVRQRDGAYIMETPGLYIKGLTDGTSTETKINELVLEGDGMGYDSYKLLTKYWNCINKISGKKIIMTDVSWCPYTQLVEGDTYNEDEADLYFKDDGHYGLKPYVWPNNLKIFEADVLNGEVYKYNPGLEESSKIIASDDMIRQLKNSHNTKLEGTMYINNEVIVDELSVSKLNSKDKYPKLKLIYGGEVNKAYSAKFVLPLELIDEATNTWTYEYVPVGDSSELSIQKVAPADYVSDKNIFTNPYDIYNPQKVYHDFRGWSTDPTGASGIITKEEWDSHIINSDAYDNMFYAIFDITSFPITFYQGNNQAVTITTPYGSNVILPSNQPWIPDTDLNLTETYAFRGYTSMEPPSGTYHIEQDDSMVQDIASEKVSGARNYYPVFTPMSVYENIHEEYFNISEGGTLSWNNAYTISGKLTIPYVIRGIAVTGITYNGFARSSNSGLDQLTHIFWSNINGNASPNFVTFGVNRSNEGGRTFAGLQNLEYIEMPPTVEIISPFCFNGCGKLYQGEYSDSTNINYYIDKAFKNITVIGERSFMATPIKDLILSDKTTIISIKAFSSMRGLSTVTLGNNLNYSLCGSEIFLDNSNLIVNAPSKYNTPDWMNIFSFGADATINWI